MGVRAGMCEVPEQNRLDHSLFASTPEGQRGSSLYTALTDAVSYRAFSVKALQYTTEEVKLKTPAK